ncbi:hypothetical protein JCM10207_003610 [Rhodosporidiobolus poonsookiae]
MRPTPPSLLKLIALPLSQPSSTHPPRFLLHAVRASLQSDTAQQRQSTSAAYIAKATDKAADLWSGLGKADEGTWKKRAYNTGEKMMDKIEYEEWALKALDPARAPKPWLAVPSSSNSSAASVAKKAKKEDDNIEILYPPSLLSDTTLLSSLKDQLAHREPHHRRAMYRCLILSPLTWPFAIIPVVPNFPLFYVLWRAWSHFRAYKASSYLLSLLSPPFASSHLKLLPSPALDAVYADAAKTGAGRSEVLLGQEQVKEIVKRFGLQEEERKELERAVWQSEQRAKAEDAQEAKARSDEVEVVKEAVKEKADK